MTKNALIAFGIALSLWTYAGAQDRFPGGPPGTDQPIRGQGVYVDSMDILILESFPVQVHVKVQGNLANPCLKFTEPVIQRQENTFYISLSAQASAGVMCIQVLQPFEQTIPLDVYGLRAGTYTVNVNGVTGTFTLAADNMLGSP